MPVKDLKALYNLITPTIDISKLMKVVDPPGGVSKTFVLRGLI